MHLSPSHRLAVVLLATALSTPTLARAQGSRDPAGAEKLYDDGAKLLAKEDWAGACSKFEGSFKLDPAPGTMLNLASCAEHDGKLALAWLRFKEAQSLNADTKSDKQRAQIEAFIKQSIERLEPKLPYLTVRVAGDLAGAVLLRDGQPLVAGAALPVDPGEHVIEVSAPGYATQKRTVTISEGKREELELRLEKAVAAPDKPADTPPVEPPKLPPPASEPGPRHEPATTMSPLRLAGIAVGGVGAATLVGTLVTGVLALDKETAIEDLGCTPTDRDTTACPSPVAAEAQALSDEGNTLALISTVTSFVGGAALGAGVLMIALGPDEPAKQEAALHVVPVFGLGHAAVLVRGEF